MLKLSNTTKNAAFAALLGAGLVGSAAVTLTPVVAHAQMHHDWDNRSRATMDDRFHGDRDDRYRGDWDDRYRRDWDDRFRFGVGVGFYGYPYSGYYYDPYYYGPYCSGYDYYYGYCSY